MAESLIFVSWELQELVDLAEVVAGVEGKIEYGVPAEYEGGFELDIYGESADLGAFHTAYDALFSED